MQLIPTKLMKLELSPSTSSNTIPEETAQGMKGNRMYVTFLPVHDDMEHLPTGSCKTWQNAHVNAARQQATFTDA